MNRALFTGLSGTIAHQQRLDVIGNNLVNANTVGYKQARTTFKDAFYQTLQAASAGAVGGMGGMNAQQVGSGVSLGASQTLFTQGALEHTGQALDAASCWMISRSLIEEASIARPIRPMKSGSHLSWSHESACAHVQASGNWRNLSAHIGFGSPSSIVSNVLGSS